MGQEVNCKLRLGKKVVEGKALLESQELIFRASDLRRHGEPEPYFIETFQWRDDKASDLAHQAPEVMALWSLPSRL